MPNRTAPLSAAPGFRGPALGPRALAFALPALLTLGTVACGEDERTRILDPIQVAMDENVPSIYEDD